MIRMGAMFVATRAVRGPVSLATFLLAFASFAFAAGQSSPNFAIPKDTINVGVGEMTSPGFRLNASVGEPASGGTLVGVAFRLAGGYLGSVTVGASTLNLLSVVSRKLHGAAPYQLTINHNEPIGGNVTVEPRMIGGGHTLVFHFDTPVTSVIAATALDAALNNAGSASFALVAGDVFVTLTNVADNARMKITLSGINGNGTAMASMGFLVGDVTNTRAVNSSDISAIKANVNKPVDGTTYKFDLNANGSITQADVTAAKARAGLNIP